MTANRPAPFRMPEVGTPEFAAWAHHESLLLAAADRSGDDQDFVDAISILWDELDDDRRAVTDEPSPSL